MDAHTLKGLLPNTADEGVATHCLRACATVRFPLSYALAILEKETGFRNVFGHDPTNGIPSTWRGTHVTYPKYKVYKYNRQRGRGMQGVGYTQLTWYEYQDQADRLGGCWKAYPNMVIGFRLMANLIKQHGKTMGAAHFNGTGDSAIAYGRNWVVKQQKWHNILSS